MKNNIEKFKNVERIATASQTFQYNYKYEF